MRALSISIGRFVDELRDSVVTAELNYQIWWVYKEQTSRARFVNTMNRYTPFFQTGIHAHFVAYLVAIYRLHEKRRDTVNIPRFIDMVEKAETVNGTVVATAQHLLAEAKPIWIKAGILRNEAFGHRTETQDIADVFSKASVTPDELVHLNTLTKKVLNGVTSHLDKTAHVFEVAAGESATRLLNDLRRLHDGVP